MRAREVLAGELARQASFDTDMTVTVSGQLENASAIIAALRAAGFELILREPLETAKRELQTIVDFPVGSMPDADALIGAILTAQSALDNLVAAISAAKEQT